LANERANTNYQTAQTVIVDRAEARQLLAEAMQRLQAVQANAPTVHEQVKELTQCLHHSTQQLTETYIEVNNLGAQVTTLLIQIKIA
jgi:hypothetical protein